MADKFRKVYPLKITFFPGEHPNSEKLTGMSSQANSAFTVIEKVIGDTWNNSGDAALSSATPLQITSLARALGPTSFTSPAFPPLTDTFRYTENIGSKFAGRNELYLLFKPDGSFYSVSGAAITGSPQTNKWDVNAAGKWWVSSSGIVHTFSALSGNETITYSVDPTTWTVGQETVPNVIPDAGQITFAGLRVSKTGDNYFIHLPPRRPLTLSTRELPARYPPSGELSVNEATTIGAPYKLWQSASVAALSDSHYRYKLPKEIQDIWSSLDDGAEIPAGYMYLWDDDTNTIIDGVRFYKPSPATTPYVVRVEQASYDFNSKVTANDNEASYSSSGLYLIVPGASMAKSLWTITNALLQHDHNNPNTGSAKVEHAAVGGLNPPTSAYTGHSTQYPTSLPTWPASRWSFDDHTSLLSRGGSQGLAGGRNRDLYDNAMLGDLVLANAASDNYLDPTCEDNSYKLAFGSSAGPSIRGTPGGYLSFAAALARFQGSITLSGLGIVDPEAGMLQWDGDHFLGYNGVEWVSLDLQGTVGAIVGSGFQSAVAFFSDTDTITGDANFTFDQGQLVFTLNGGVIIGNPPSGNGEAGMIRWDGTHFQGYDGEDWLNLDMQGDPNAVTGSGIAGDVAYWDSEGSIAGSINLRYENQNLAIHGTVQVSGVQTTPAAGMIQWTGTNFQGYTGSVWLGLDQQATPPAGSLGYAQFNGGSGQFGADAAFFWDNTSKRLGIGTVAPTKSLDIATGGELITDVANLRSVPVYASQQQVFTGNPSGGNAWGSTYITGMTAQQPQGIDASDDGQVIIITVYGSDTGGGQVWISRNYGASFTRVEAFQMSGYYWWDCCCDADGSHMAVFSIYNGNKALFVSTDGGYNWVNRTTANGGQAQGWWSIDMDDDGSHIITTGRAEGGDVRLSTDYGATWSVLTSIAGARGSGSPISCAISGDGSKILVLTYYYTSRMIYSTNTGSTWSYTEKIGGGDFSEKCAAISRDGSVMLAVAQSYTNNLHVSTNYGANWAARNGVQYDSCISGSMSADGTRMIIGTQGTKVLRSLDSGGSFGTLRDSTGQAWKAVCQVRDGSTVILCSSNLTPQIEFWAPSTRWLVGNTSLSNNDFSYGVDLSTTIDNIVAAYNAKVGKNCTASKYSTSIIKYTANVGGTAGNSYPCTHINDGSGTYSFLGGATTLAGGMDASGRIVSDGFIAIGSQVAPTSGFGDVNDVVTSGDLEVKGNLRVNGTLSGIVAGAIGQVQFNNGDNHFGADSNLFWDNTSKRLGVGTSSPTKALHVAGDVLVGVANLNATPSYAATVQTWTGNPSGAIAWGTIGSTHYTRACAQDDSGRYVLTGYDNTFILSSNFGLTFGAAVVTLPSGFVTCCAVSGNGATMVAFGTDTSNIYSPVKYVYISTDYGVTWTNISSSFPGPSQPIDCDIDSDGSFIIASYWVYGPGTYACYSTNYGASWTNCPNSGAASSWTAVACDGDGSVFAHGKSNVLWYTTNGGTSWSSYTLTTGGYGLGGISMNSTGSVIVTVVDKSLGGGNNFCISTDSGQSFTVKNGPTTDGYSKVCVSTDGLCIVVATPGINASGMYISRDTSSTWSARQDPQGQQNLYYTPCVDATGQQILAINPGSSVGIYTYAPPHRFMVGNTAVGSGIDFAYGGDLTTTLTNIVTAFNNKAGKNCTAVKTSGTQITYTANTAGTIGNALLSQHIKDTSNTFSFTGTNLTGGVDAGGYLQSIGYINIGPAATPASGYSDAGDVITGGDLEVVGNLKIDTALNVVGNITTMAKVGIGTTSPQFQLDLDGPCPLAKFGASFPVYLSAPGPYIGFNSYYDPSGGWKFGKGSTAHYASILGIDTTGGRLVGYTSNAGAAGGLVTWTERFTVLNNGNFGIGTATPTNTLYVLGTATIQGNYLSLAGEGSTSSGLSLSHYSNGNTVNNAVSFWSDRGTLSPRSGVAVQSGDKIGDINFNEYITGGWGKAAAISVYADGAPGSGSSPGKLELSTTASGANTPTARMTILKDGSVGIGTTSPGYRLHVSGGRTVVQSAPETYCLGIARTDYSGAYWLGINASSTPDLLFSNVGGVERMRIQDDGKVGIGTTAYESGDLVLAGGNIRAKAASVSLVAHSTSTTGFSTINCTVDDGGGGYFASFGSASGVNEFRIHSVRNNTGSMTFWTQTSSVLTERMRISNDGMVGIGKVPTVMLDVAGKGLFSSTTWAPLTAERTNANTTGYFGTIKALASTSADMADDYGSLVGFWIKDGGGEFEIARTGAMRYGADNSGRLRFDTANAGTPTEKMTIMPDGKVGIGTTSPTKLLDVYGDMIAGVVSLRSVPPTAASSIQTWTANPTTVAGWGFIASGNSQVWTGLISNDAGDRLYATTTASTGYPNYTSTVWTSINGGLTWSSRWTVGYQILDIACDSTGQKLLVVCSYNNPGSDAHVYTSTDYGANWSDRTAAAGTAWWWGSCCMSSDGGVMYIGSGDATNRIVKKSTDGGATWNGTSTNPGSHATRMACSDDGQIVAIQGEAYVKVTLNGGTSWPNVSSQDTHGYPARLALSGNGSVVVSIGAHVQGDQFGYSTNSGASWTFNAGPGDKRMFSVAMDSTGQKIIVGTGASYDGYAYYTSNLGTNWAQMNPAGATNKTLIRAAMNSDATNMVMTSNEQLDQFYLYSAGTNFVVGNTTLKSTDFTIGGDLTTTLTNVVSAFNAKAGNTTALKLSGTQVSYTANTPGTTGNTYLTTHVKDSDNVYSFPGSTLTGGIDAAGNMIAPTGYINLGPLAVASTGYGDVGDVLCGQDLEVIGKAKIGSTLEGPATGLYLLPKVGIGIAAPTNILHVSNPSGAGTFQLQGSTNAQLRVSSTAAGVAEVKLGNLGVGNRYAYIDFVGDDTYTSYGMRIIRGNGGPNSTSQFFHRGTGNFDFSAEDAAPIAFWTTATERMRILAGGWVGIGISNPTSRFVVNEPSIGATNTIAAFVQPSLTDTQGVRIALGKANSGDNCGLLSYFYNGTTPSLSALRFGTHTTAPDVLTVRGDSRVGINVVAPTVALDVAGQGKFSSATHPVILSERTSTATDTYLACIQAMHKSSADMVDGFGSNIQFAVTDSGIAAGLGNVGARRNGADNSGRLVFETYNVGTVSEKMTILANGKVGIATAAPTKALEINGETLTGWTYLKGVGLSFASTIQTWTGNPTLGTAWASYTNTGNTNQMRMIAQSHNGQVICALDSQGGGVYQVFVSVNGGASWTVPATLPTNQIWGSISCSSTGQYMLITGDSIYTSADYGATWTVRIGGTNNCTGGAINGSGAIMIAFGYWSSYSRFKRSTDYGVTWTDVIPAATYSYANSAAISEDGSVIAFTNSSQIISSRNSGANWTAYSNGNPASYCPIVMSSDGTYILVCTDASSGNRVFKSSDAGLNWTVPSAGPGRAFSLAMSQNGGVVVMGTATTNTGHIHKSVDYGATWTDMGMPTGFNNSSYWGISCNSVGENILTVNAVTSGPIYKFGNAIEFTVGNTSLNSSEFSYGGSLSITLDNVVAAFNAKGGKDTTATKTSGTQVTFTANTAGVGGNSLVSTHTTDSENRYSFPGTTLSGGGLEGPVNDGGVAGKLVLYPFDGTSLLETAGIRGAVNGTVSTGSIPTDIVFFSEPTGLGTEQARITHDGTMGIGTAAPAGRLDIVGSDSVPHIRIQKTSGPYEEIGVGDWGVDKTLKTVSGVSVSDIGTYIPDGNYYLDNYLDDLGFFAFYTKTGGSSHERLRIANNGCVGIGTSTPGGVQLNVVGEGAWLRLDASEVGYAYAGWDLKHGATELAECWADTDGLWWFSNGIPTTGKIQFGTTISGVSAPQTRLTIANNGFVGIGEEANVASLLHLRGDDPVLTLQTNVSGVSGTDIDFLDRNGDYLGWMGVQHEGWFRFSSEVEDLGGFEFKTQTAGLSPTRMRIYNSGRVNIGGPYEEPESKLHVADDQGGGIELTLQAIGATGNWADIAFLDKDKNYMGDIGIDMMDNHAFYMSNQNNNTGSYEIYTKTGGSLHQRVHIANDGKFGIGTNSPTSLLHVQGGDQAILNIEAFQNPGFTAITFLTSGIVTADLGSAEDGAMWIGSDIDDTGTVGFYTTTSGEYTERVHIANDGNVGIGTSDPQEQLDIRGNLTVSGQIVSQLGPTDWPSGLGQTINWNDGNMQILELENVTVSGLLVEFVNGQAGAHYMLKVVQGTNACVPDFTGGGATILTPGGDPIVLSTEDNAIDLLQVICESPTLFYVRVVDLDWK